MRSASALATIARINAIPIAQRTLDNPKYLDFLLYDNPQPKNPKPIRTPLLPFFPDARHAQMVVRLLGNESIKKEGKTADLVTAATKSLHFDARADHDHRRARAAREPQQLPHRRHGDAGADRDRRS